MTWTETLGYYAEDALSLPLGAPYLYGLYVLHLCSNLLGDAPGWWLAEVLVFVVGAFLLYVHGRRRARVGKRSVLRTALVAAVLVGPGVLGMGGATLGPFPLIFFLAVRLLDPWNLVMNVVMLLTNTLYFALGIWAFYKVRGLLSSRASRAEST